MPEIDPMQRFSQYLRIERGLTESTIEQYRSVIRRFFAFVKKPIEEVTERDVRDWLYATGGAPSTVNAKLAGIKAYLKSLDLPDVTAKITHPKQRRHVPHPIADVDDKIKKLNGPYRDIAEFLLETGLRISEACSIHVAVPVPDTLLIVGKGEKERLVLLTERAQELLNGLNGKIVEVGRGKRNIQRKFQQAGFKAHGLRHTFGTQLAEAGNDLGEIQSLMGHSSPVTTRGYAEYSTNRLRAALDRKTNRGKEKNEEV